MTYIHDLYYVALAADQAYSAELNRMYGKTAGDKRYDHRYNSATDALRQLRDAKIAADEAYHHACRENFPGFTAEQIIAGLTKPAC